MPDLVRHLNVVFFALRPCEGMLALFTVVVKALFVPLRPSYPRFLCLQLFFFALVTMLGAP